MKLDAYGPLRQAFDTYHHAERAILGGLLLPPEAEVSAAARRECLELTPAAFSDARHRTVLCVLQQLATQGPIDEILVLHALAQRGRLADAGGAAYVCGLSDSCVSPANLPLYANMLREAAAARITAEMEAELGHFASCGTFSWQEVREARPPRLLLSDPNDEHGMFPRQHVSIVAARGGTGKSHMGLQLAVSLASGRPFLSTAGGMGGFGGNDVNGNVLVWSAEDGPDIVKHRLAGIIRALDLDDEAAETALGRIKVQTGPTQLAVTDQRSGTLMPTAACSQLELLLSRNQWDLIIVDSLAIIGPPDVETNNVQAHNFLRDTLAALAAKAPGEPAMVVTHHTGKGYQNGRADQDAIRGASGIVNGAREAWLVGPMPPAEGMPMLYELACVKANLQAPRRESIVLTRHRDYGAMLWQATADTKLTYFVALEAAKEANYKRRNGSGKIEGNGSHNIADAVLPDKGKLS